jgi:plastocyanin/glucose dehydrogenase
VLLRPNNNGGTNFSPTSYHPPTGYVFVNGNEANQATTVDMSAPREFEVGKSYTRQVNAAVVGSSLTQTFTAMDSRNNKIVWQKRKPGGQSYGWVSTASNLAFGGNIDGTLTAFDVKTGDELWKFQVGWGISAPPMTYMVDGVQYVAVAAGGNRGGLTTLDGDAVWAFSLNGVIDEVPAPPAIQSKVAAPLTNVTLGGEVGTPVTQGGTWTFQGTFRTYDYRYDPVGVTVPKGTTLSWENLGASIHTATEANGAWDTGDIANGQTRSITFDSAGTFDYICKPHPWMIGRIVVTE